MKLDLSRRDVFLGVGSCVGEFEWSGAFRF